MLIAAVFLIDGVSSRMLDDRLLAGDSGIKSERSEIVACNEGGLKRDSIIGSLSFLTGCITTLVITKAVEYHTYRSSVNARTQYIEQEMTLDTSPDNSFEERGFTPVKQNLVLSPAPLKNNESNSIERCDTADSSPKDQDPEESQTTINDLMN